MFLKMTWLSFFPSTWIDMMKKMLRRRNLRVLPSLCLRTVSATTGYYCRRASRALRMAA